MSDEIRVLGYNRNIEINLDYSFKMTLRDKLQQLRKKKKVSLKRMAKESGMRYDTVVSLERKEIRSCDPKISTLLSLAKYYEISVDELIKGIKFGKK